MHFVTFETSNKNLQINKYTNERSHYTKTQNVQLWNRRWKQKAWIGRFWTANLHTYICAQLCHNFNANEPLLNIWTVIYVASGRMAAHLEIMNIVDPRHSANLDLDYILLSTIYRILNGIRANLFFPGAY